MSYLDFIPKNLRPHTVSDSEGQHIVHDQHLTHSASGAPTGYAYDRPREVHHEEPRYEYHREEPGHEYHREMARLPYEYHAQSAIPRGYGGGVRHRYGQPLVEGGSPLYGPEVLAGDGGTDDAALIAACKRQAEHMRGRWVDGRYHPSPLDGMSAHEVQLHADSCRAIELRNEPRRGQPPPDPGVYKFLHDTMHLI